MNNLSRKGFALSALISGSVLGQDTIPTTMVVQQSENSSTVVFSLGDYSKQRTLHDSDRDGWCDLWCALHPTIHHRNMVTDTDSDGLTDYQEMVLMRSATAASPMPRKLSLAEITANKNTAKKKRIAPTPEEVGLRSLFEPFMVEESVDSRGNPTSIEKRRQDKLGQVRENSSDAAG